MKNDEAKFILGAYRPDGRDANDPAFVAALAQAERDPELRAWFEQQRQLDATLAAKLHAIVPPPGLREAILAGARASAPRAKRRWWSNPGWLAAAAALALAAIVGVNSRSGKAPLAAADFAAFAIRDIAEAHAGHVGEPAGLAGVQAQFASARLPLTGGLNLDLDELQRKNCRTVKVAGREVFELCFLRDGTWYHVYVGRRSDFAPGAIDPQALVTARGEYASTAWADANHVFALVTAAGTAALRRVI